MSLSLDQLQGDLREYYTRIEEVLSGMDAVVAQLQDRVAKLEGKQATIGTVGTAGSVEQRVARLEGQLAALVAVLENPEPPDSGGSAGIIIRS